MVKCNTKDCEKIAKYGYELKDPLACGIHRILEPNNLKMFNVVNKRCFCGKSQPYFGLENGKATHCVMCKTEKMFDVITKKCFCEKSKAYFGLEKGKPTHCVICKTKKMFDVKNKKCFCGNMQPIFGLVNGKPTHCVTCKTEEMFDVVNKKCFCGKSQAYFGLEKGKATHCVTCKTEEMFDVINKKCFCGKHGPYFGLEKGKATHCGKCKTSEMFDVISKKCFCGISIPYFGLVAKKPTHCAVCKTNDMFNVVSKKCFCGKCQPYFGLEKGKATHCSSCKTNKMFDVIHEKCKTEYCDTTTSNPAYEGYCMRCFMYTFPDRPVARNYKTKETAMVEYVKQKYPNLDWVWDKKIVGGVSLRRPDLFVDLDDMILIVECQENHHKNDIEICINRRMMELSLDNQHKPMLIIYFNPDSYIDENGKKVVSCWSTTKTTGIIKISNKIKWNDRLKILGDKIEYWLNKKTLKTLEIDKLFHDKI